MNEQQFVDALTIAYLYAQGKTQDHIADILDLSQAQVSRLLATVRDDYIRHEFRRERVDDEQWQKILQRAAVPSPLMLSLDNLSKGAGRRGPTVHRVAPLGELRGYPRTTAFAVAAAPILKELLGTVNGNVGVAWGNAIWGVTQALRPLLPRPLRPQNPVEFVPLCGDPLSDSLEDYSDRTSSRIASDLSKLVNGDDVRPLWLGLVPAFIPRGLPPKEERAIQDFVHLKIPQYMRVFGPHKPLAADLNMILTACGSAKTPVQFGKYLLDLKIDERQRLTESIYGDIGGVLVTRAAEMPPKRWARVAGLVDEINRLWTGLRMQHLRDCAARAFAPDGATEGRIGVTLLAYTEDRADVVLEAVRQGLVNHLIISPDVEEAIEKRVGRQA